MSKYQITFLPLAEEELASAALWYEEQRKGLGSQFLTAVEASIEAVKRTPMLFAIVHQDIRRARVKRFPYGIFFTHDEHEVVIVSVFHARRKPKAPRNRS